MRRFMKWHNHTLLVDLKNNNPDDEMQYSDENAQQLVENSSEFDNWLNEVVFDLENFRSKEQTKDTKEVNPVSG